MEKKVSKKELKEDIKYLERQKEEMTRIISEIENESTKMLSQDRINEIIRGKKGKLEDAKKLSNNLRKNSIKEFKLNSIKNLIITLNITLIAVPYILVGGVSYVIMDSVNAAPYHENTNIVYSNVTELRDNFGNSTILDSEEIEKYGEDSLIITTPWEKTGEVYTRNVFTTDDYSSSVFDSLEESDPIDLIAEYVFDDIKTEESTTAPVEEGNDFLIQATSTYKDKENGVVEKNTKEEITKNSLIHAGITVGSGSIILAGAYTIMRKRRHKYILDDRIDEINSRKKYETYSKDKKKEIKNKIKSLRK